MESDGEAYHKAAALSVLLTYHKLRDNLEDDSFFKSLGSRLFLPFVSRKARKAAEEYPFLAQEAQKAMDGQRQAEETPGRGRLRRTDGEPAGGAVSGAGLRQPPGSGLERFGYFLGRWVYLMDAADDLLDDLKEGAFNPFIPRLGLSGKTELTPRSARPRTRPATRR